MSKLKLPIIIVLIVAAAAAGLVSSGKLGGGSDGPPTKHVIEPVPLAGPFSINLTDTDTNAYVSLNIAVQLEPMKDAEYAAFTGAGGGGHGGGGEAPGPPKVAAYPKFHDAVLTVTSRYDSSTLLTEEGKEELRAALLDRFNEIAVTDEADAGAGEHDPTHVGPPYHVMDVLFTKYVIQTG